MHLFTFVVRWEYLTFHTFILLVVNGLWNFRNKIESKGKGKRLGKERRRKSKYSWFEARKCNGEKALLYCLKFLLVKKEKKKDRNVWKVSIK